VLGQEMEVGQWACPVFANLSTSTAMCG
jgi:hypothetical protein